MPPRSVPAPAPGEQARPRAATHAAGGRGSRAQGAAQPAAPGGAEPAHADPAAGEAAARLAAVRARCLELRAVAAAMRAAVSGAHELVEQQVAAARDACEAARRELRDSVAAKLRKEEQELRSREEALVRGAGGAEWQREEFVRQVESIRLMMEFTQQSCLTEAEERHARELADLKGAHRKERDTMREQFRLYRERAEDAERAAESAHRAELARQRESAARIRSLVEIDNHRLQQEVVRLHELLQQQQGAGLAGHAVEDLDDVGPPSDDASL
eukprot:TRINITY_DN16921_c0_g1_i1.p1 TRINITY_DN16921_c0_g1~~TRINITY_DN16921_c0_g1_i1.p1  ORF type:complete len:272 (+),score=105.89 TRINITY_DN16921_c0_g1_i1:77-892(+)